MTHYYLFYPERNDSAIWVGPLSSKEASKQFKKAKEPCKLIEVKTTHTVLRTKQ